MVPPGCSTEGSQNTPSTNRGSFLDALSDSTGNAEEFSIHDLHPAGNDIVINMTTGQAASR
jgi:hypothetical protein